MIKIEDVDGTIPGKAALVIINLDDPWGEGSHSSLMRSDYDEEMAPNPVQACWRLWEGTKNDWPGYNATVVSNERAKYLEWKDRMKALDLNSSPEFYIQCANNSGVTVKLLG